jgi:phage baseplate assembly protein W
MTVSAVEIAQPFNLDGNGNIATVTSSGDITQQHVNALISTEQGSRVMLPTYGIDLTGMMFAPNDPILLNLIQNDVTDAFNNWEPSITITNVAQTQQTDAQMGVAAINVSYAVGTNVTGTAVGPTFQNATISQGGTVVNS